MPRQRHLLLLLINRLVHPAIHLPQESGTDPATSMPLCSSVPLLVLHLLVGLMNALQMEVACAIQCFHKKLPFSDTAGHVNPRSTQVIQKNLRLRTRRELLAHCHPTWPNK